MKSKDNFFWVIIGVITFCIFPIQTNAQVVDTIFNSTGRITLIELIKNNPGEIFIGNAGTCVSKSTDYGQIWVTSLFDTATSGCYDISFDQSNTQVGFLGGATNLYKTADGGYNWFNTNQLEDIYLVDVNPNFPYIIFAQGSIDPLLGSYYLYISADYGGTWQDSLINHWILDLQFHPVNDSIAYGYYNTNILKTTDIGRSWEAILSINNLESRFTALSVDRYNPGILYASRIGSLYKTTNDGNNWNDIGSTLKMLIPSFEIRSILLDDSISGRLYIGLAEGLFLTEDDGLYWKQIYNDPIYLIEADSETPRNIYFTTNYEKTAIRLVDTLTVTTVNEINNLQPIRFSLFQNYPNPFNPTTTIKYYLKAKSNVQLIIYDISGKIIKIIINESQSAGEHSVPFSANQMASGIYFYKLKIGSFEQSRKMLLLQ